MFREFVSLCIGFYAGAYFQDKYKISPVKDPKELGEDITKFLKDFLTDKRP